MKRVAYVTDLHLEEAFPKQHHVDATKNWLHVLADIQSENITNLVIGGDIGEASAHPWFFRSIKGFSFQLTPGNHDDYKELQKHHLPASQGTGELYYREEDAVFKFLFLDTSSTSLSAQQLRWLKQELHTRKKVCVFLHHPVLPVATKVATLHALQNREEVYHCLMQSQREMTVFCGHYHLADEQQAGNIRQVIGPAASFQMRKSPDAILIDGSEFGYRILTFTDDGSIDTKLKLFRNHSLQAGVAALP